MEHIERMPLSLLLVWCILNGLVICLHRATAVNSHCSALVYGGGASASVTCYFSEDLGPILKNYGGYVMEYETEDGESGYVVESYWRKPESFFHVVKDGYSFNGDGITDRLTVIIPQLTDRFKGRYHCAVFPSHNGKHDYCTLDDMSPTAPVVSTARPTVGQSTQTPNTTETQSHSMPDGGLVLTIVFPVLACIVAAAASALVFLMWRRRKRRRRFHKPTIQGSDPILPTTDKEAIMG